MLNIIIGFLLLLTFIGFVVYAVKGGNLMIGFFVMAVLWAVIGMVPFNEAIYDIFAKPALDYGATIIYIVFGSWFGRVLVDSGIATSISNDTRNVGKKSPIIAAILICLVTAFIFISAFGVGSAIAIGVILLPIMFAIGVPKNIAVSAFTLSIGAAMYVNVVLFNQIKVFFPQVTYGDRYLQFGWIGAAIQMMAVIVMLLLNAKTIRRNNQQGNNDIAEFDTPDSGTVPDKKVSHWTYIIPIFPVLLNMVFKWDAVPSLLISTLLAMLMTGEFKTFKNASDFIGATIQKAISDIAGLIMFLMAIVMFAAAATKNAARFADIFKFIIPHSTLVLCLIFGILAPLALFRGPLHVWGAGAATASVLAGLHLFSPWFLLPLLYVPTLLAVSTDVTQSWNVWALSYSKLDNKTYLKTGVPVAWAVAIINEIVVYFLFG